MTGAANGHLIRDVGTAYLRFAQCGRRRCAIWRHERRRRASAAGDHLMRGARRSAYLVDIAEGCAAAPGGTVTDWLGVIFPGVVTAALCGWSLRFRQT